VVELFDQDRNPEIFGPAPMWARQLYLRLARRQRAIHHQLRELKEAILPTLDDLTSAISAVQQKVNDLADRTAQQAANPIPQSAIDAVNAIGTQVDSIDPAPAPASVEPVPTA
jgi:hypothetical protein